MLTIITPTFNRAELLKKCYVSLQEQTNKDFLWLIIDDGSTDHTKTVVEGFVAAKPEFLIEYHYKENGGKHTALNFSHEFIKGDYCLVLDSDDILVNDAIERVYNAWEKWHKHSEVGRIIFQHGYIQSSADPVCYVKHPNTPVNSLKEKRISISGRDCCDTFRTSLFIKYKFPVFPGEKFLGEGSGWLPIEFESKAVYINEIIYRCEYLEDGLSKSGRKMFLSNPVGGMYNSKIYMDSRLPLTTRFKKGTLYNCYSKFAGVKFSQALKDNDYKVLTILTRLPGLAFYYYWKTKLF